MIDLDVAWVSLTEIALLFVGGPLLGLLLNLSNQGLSVTLYVHATTSLIIIIFNKTYAPAWITPTLSLAVHTVKEEVRLKKLIKNDNQLTSNVM